MTDYLCCKRFFLFTLLAKVELYLSTKDPKSDPCFCYTRTWLLWFFVWGLNMYMLLLNGSAALKTETPVLVAPVYLNSYMFTGPGELWDQLISGCVDLPRPRIETKASSLLDQLRSFGIFISAWKTHQGFTFRLGLNADHNFDSSYLVFILPCYFMWWTLFCIIFNLVLLFPDLCGTSCTKHWYFLNVFY